MKNMNKYEYISDEQFLEWLDDLFKNSDEKEDKKMGLFREAKVLEDGIYEAEIVDVSLVNTMYGDKYKISFKIVNDGEEYNLNIFSGEVIGKRSKIYKLIKALNLNKPIEKVEKSDLIGKKVKVVVKANERGFARISEFLS